MEVLVKEVEIQKVVNELFAKFGSPENRKIARRNLRKIRAAEKEAIKNGS